MFFQHGEHGDHGDTRRAVHPISVASVISVLERPSRGRGSRRVPPDPISRTRRGQPSISSRCPPEELPTLGRPPCNDIRERSAPVPLRNLCALRSSAIHSSLLFFSSTAAPSHSSPRLAETNGHAKMFFSTRRARRSRRHQTSGASDLCGLGDLCVGTDRAQAAAGVTSPRTGFTYPPRAAEHLFESGENVMASRRSSRRRGAGSGR